MSGTIRVTLAAAGTGKTTFLVDAMVQAIRDGVAPERILATSFTVAAAAELVERSRARLLALGDAAAAAALVQARIGTTHAVCGRIVEDFAFELGLSPALGVMAEDEAAAAFLRSSEAAFACHADRLDALADVFGAAPGGWRGAVRRIVALARANGIEAGALSACAERSIAELAGCFPGSAGAADGLDAALAAAVRDALAALDGREVDRNSQAAVSALVAAVARIEVGDAVPWPSWVEIASIRVAACDEDLFARLKRAAEAHAGHPRLRDDVEAHVRGVFACAADAMGAYVDDKRDAGLVDFDDQERLALEVLGRGDAVAYLRDEIDLVLVDEIQDASPIEIAVYAALARIAPASVWVGDLKQSIFAFRQADSLLAGEALDAVSAASGAPVEVLVRSWRARPALCAFVNAVFAPVFDAAGLDRASSRFAGHEDDPDPLGCGPLHVWPLAGRSDGQKDAALAQAVAGLVAAPTGWSVRDGDVVRAAEARDVAVLCHRNSEVERVAGALAALGVPVSFDRSDLVGRPEAELVLAAVRWIADRDDRLALVDMVRLVGGDGGEEPEAWLEAFGTPDADAALLALLPFGRALESIGERRLALTPTDVLDAIVTETGLLDVVARWGDAEGRLDVLDALRGRAMRYAEGRKAGEPSTLAGLAGALAVETDRSRSAGGHGVTVTTWHRAKGREWPVVVLQSLGRRDAVRLDDPVVEADGDTDWNRPLQGRWIRAWPTPYGRRTIGTPLRDAMLASGPGTRAAERRRAESVRLLYVGFTRARDHLVFPTASDDLPWLDDLDLDGERRFVLPRFDGVPIRVDGIEWPATFRKARTSPPPAVIAPSPFLPEACRPASHPPLFLRPSDAVQGRAVGFEEWVVGARIALRGTPDMAHVGEAFHAFVAVDDRRTTGRETLADGILSRWEVAANLSGSDVVLAADRMWRFLDGRFPDWTWRREVPVVSPMGHQVVSGRMDLLGDAGGAFAIVDHKTFPGRDGLEARLAGAGAQLSLYADAVAAATGWTCSGLFVHLPMLGRMFGGPACRDDGCAGGGAKRSSG